MNPFQKLRRAVDKVNIEFEFPQQTQSSRPHTPSKTNRASQNDEPHRNNVQNQSNKDSKINQGFSNTLMEEQTYYIQQINQLLKKNEKLARSLAIESAQKDQLIEQNCILQKNNEILQQKVHELVEQQTELRQRERKYNQEIHRINRTIEMLGAELNNEKTMKKNAINEVNRIKNDVDGNCERDNKKIEELQTKISTLQQEIRERTQMLEFYIKKNSEDRKQTKLNIQRIKSQYEHKVQQLTSSLMAIKDQLNQIKSTNNILNYTLQTAKTNHTITQTTKQQLEKDVQSLSETNQQLICQLNQMKAIQRDLSSENEFLKESLKSEKQNIKLKVVEIRDETLELQLQMYKRQCKDLLQQRSLSQKIHTERVFEPSYQIKNQ